MRRRWWSSSWIWIILAAVVVIAAAIAGAYFFFAAPIPDGPPDTTGMNPETAAEATAAELEIARMRTEARRNALALGAGLAALAALALAVRRQYHHEQTTVKTQEDALQRRITDARVRAVEQLGSDNPAVRIGGLHNLERIGQLHPELRQVVLDEICSYLRLPYALPGAKSKPERLPDRQFEPVGPPPAEADGDETEGEVRLIAQEILQRHLNSDREELYWDHSRLNLRNARLDGIDFRGCHLTGADFTEATFYNNAGFWRATFTGRANFGEATFTGDANFGEATFTGDADFEGATFTGRANFGEATFTGDADFWRATFTGRAGFEGATFTGDADFEGATFTGRAGFLGATFTGRAGFWRATFTGRANFGEATFTGDADFEGATFTGRANFAGARFRGALLGASLVMLEALRKRGVLLRTDVEHQLPAGWALESDPSDSAWGHLVTPGASDPDGSEA